MVVNGRSYPLSVQNEQSQQLKPSPAHHHVDSGVTDMELEGIMACHVPGLGCMHGREGVQSACGLSPEGKVAVVGVVCETGRAMAAACG